jgi:hypothetical protein
MGRQAVDNLTLERWRSTDAVVVLGALSRHMKQDLSYTPRTDRRTSRWHINVAGRDLEILCDGPKFFGSSEESVGGRRLGELAKCMI